MRITEKDGKVTIYLHGMIEGATIAAFAQRDDDGRFGRPWAEIKLPTGEAMADTLFLHRLAQAIDRCEWAMSRWAPPTSVSAS